MQEWADYVSREPISSAVSARLIFLTGVAGPVFSPHDAVALNLEVDLIILVEIFLTGFEQG